MRNLDRLTPFESAALLRTLLQRRPDLRADAEAIAESMLADADIDQVADEVEDAIRQSDVDELHGRAGRQPEGYVEPGEAAWAILEEAIEPFNDDLRRRLDLGRHDAAMSLAIGIVLGLYRCRRHDDADLIAWAEDSLLEAAAGALQVAVAAPRPDRPAKLPERLVREAPEWIDALRRVWN